MAVAVASLIWCAFLQIALLGMAREIGHLRRILSARSYTATLSTSGTGYQYGATSSLPSKHPQRRS